MIQLIVGVIAGGLFGAGLVLSEMTNPLRVLGFLDFFGTWDPRLAFVMVGAIVVHAPVVVWLRRRGRSLLDGPLHLPQQSSVDRRLLLGATVFGLGWGLAGYCPGPALVAAPGSVSALLLTLAMCVGMLLHDRIVSRNVAELPKRNVAPAADEFEVEPEGMRS
jgi:uncharacterized membrane protein YedE/YeeE